MTGLGHLMIGGSLTVAGMSFVDEITPIQFIAGLSIGVVASVLPDIDADNSVLQVFVAQGGRTTLTNTLVSYKDRKSMIGGIAYACLSIIELSSRMILMALIGILKLFTHHRGATHYLITPVVLSFIFLLISFIFGVSLIYVMAFFVGYLSHLLADGMTKSGVRFLAPFYKSSIHLLPKDYRIYTGRGEEFIVVFVIIVVSVLAVYLNKL